MKQILPQAAQVLERLEAAGYEGYLVGGCVRDLLLGRIPADWDMTTSARPEDVLALFEGFALPTGLQHGTVTVRLDGASFEVTTYRVDGTYGDHRHPDSVSFTGDLSEDLRRRDFTVNAMAMDRRGHVVDPLGGQADLRRGVIRAVGDPTRRFSEDALRILRAVRFSAALGFPVEAETDRAVHAMAGQLRAVAAERIRTELLKLICGADAARVLLAYPDVIGVFLPEILPAVGCDQKNYHHCYDVWEHTARALGAVKAESVLRMTMLLHDLGKPGCMTLDEAGVGHFKGHAAASCALAAIALRRLRFDNASAERILTLVKWHDVTIEPTRRAVRRLMNKLGAEAAAQLLQVKRADNLAQAPAYRGRQQEIDVLEGLLQELIAEDACFSLKQLAVNGRDLLALGCAGREVGQALDFLLREVLEERLPNEKAALLAALDRERRNK